MHIGIDVRLPFYQMGGISQYILHLLPALAELDNKNQYSLFHLQKDGRSHTPPSAPNFQRKNVYTPCHHKLERWALGLELLPRGLDVLHSPDFIPPQWGGRRKVITVHDLNFIFYPQFLTRDSMAYYADQIAWAVQVADHISADSHATRHDLIEQLRVPPEKITTVHLAANPLYERVYEETAVSATLQKHNLPRGFILFVGTLEPRKNLPFLIRAYDELLEKAEALMRRHKGSADADVLDDLPVLTDIVEVEDAAGDEGDGKPVDEMQMVERLIALDARLARAIEDWMETELPQIVAREVATVGERIREQALAHLRATLLPRLSQDISALLDPEADEGRDGG